MTEVLNLKITVYNGNSDIIVHDGNSVTIVRWMVIKGNKEM